MIDADRDSAWVKFFAATGAEPQIGEKMLDRIKIWQPEKAISHPSYWAV
jgi:hypothetical protein